MRLFDENSTVKLILENKNRFVRLAADDLARDIARVSLRGELPEICDWGDGIIIRENSQPDLDPVRDESFSIVCEGERIVISAPTYFGTIWGIYTFSEKFLGISPTYIFDGIEPQKVGELSVDPFEINENSVSFGFRGIFINDEDLLTGWVKSGGRREINYPWYNDTVDTSVMDRVVETALRLRLNLIIPASFLDIDNPPEKALADCVAKRGIYLSQHHIEPVGVSAFTFEKYLAEFNKQGEFSYMKNPDLMREIWQYYAEKWSEYDNVVWQIGLRGKCDRPVWEEAVPTRAELSQYGRFIGEAIAEQKAIIERATNGRARHFTSTLWMEGAKLAKEGFLSLPEGVIAVFADNGPNQMYANDFYEVERDDGRQYGIYYHVQYFGLGPHLAPLTGLDKLHYNLKLAYDKEDSAYIILNSSNIREFTLELGAYSEMTRDMEGFSKEAYLDEYASRFGDLKNDVKAAVKDYFDAVAVLDTSLLSRHSGKFFDYRYEDVEGIKNHAVKDGMVVNVCRHIIENLENDYFSSLWTEYYNAILPSISKYEAVRSNFDKIASRAGAARLHFEAHWLVYSDLMLSLYKCFKSLYDAKQSDGEDRLEKLREAYTLIDRHLCYRRIAEVGDFKNWYRGENKLDLPRLLREIKVAEQDLI